MTQQFLGPWQTCQKSVELYNYNYIARLALGSLNDATDIEKIEDLEAYLRYVVYNTAYTSKTKRANTAIFGTKVIVRILMQAYCVVDLN